MKIGIAGHPEGSPDISDSKLEEAMKDKKPFSYTHLRAHETDS